MGKKDVVKRLKKQRSKPPRPSTPRPSAVFEKQMAALFERFCIDLQTAIGASLKMSSSLEELTERVAIPDAGYWTENDTRPLTGALQNLAPLDASLNASAPSLVLKVFSPTVISDARGNTVCCMEGDRVAIWLTPGMYTVLNGG